VVDLATTDGKRERGFFWLPSYSFQEASLSTSDAAEVFSCFFLLLLKKDP